MPKLSQSKARKDEAKSSTAVTNTTTATGKKKRTRRSVPRETPTQRSSVYRGVTRHRWTGRYEAHLWDKNCWNESQNKKGKQVYLGAYDDEEMAARAYDLAALKYWGPETILNSPVSNYEKELKEMEGQSREEYIGSLRRKSNGFSRGVSKYRGVARHHHNGRWEARIGRVFGNKYLYLGTYGTQEEAATAYDMAAIEYRGLNAVTNFDLSRYIRWLKPNNQTNNDTTTTEFKSTDDHANPNPNPNLMLEATTSTSSANIDLYTPNLDFLNSLENSQQFMATNNGCSGATMAQHRQTNVTSSALGLLLQSSKFKEMMEMTSSTVAEEATKSCSFPEDVQTYFDYFQGPSSSNFEDSGNDTFFNEFISSLETPPMI